MTDSTLSLQKSDLIQPVRKLLQSETVEILIWDLQTLSGSFRDKANIVKVFGQAVDNDNSVEWSMALKIIESPVNSGIPWFGGDIDNAFYWRREAHIFESDFLDSVPSLFVVPDCYGIVEKPNNILWMWIEFFDNQRSHDEWSVEHYLKLAYRLGRFNGSYLNDYSLPNHEWLSRKFLDSWMGTAMYTLPYWENPDQQRLFWEHPVIQNAMGTPSNNAFYQIIQQQEAVLKKLNQLPETLSHRDVWATNMMCIGDDEQIALIDWALTGIGPIGEDLSVLIWGITEIGSPILSDELESKIFTQYLEGLRDSGWDGDQNHVQFAYAASYVLRAGTVMLVFLNNGFPLGSKTSMEARDYIDTLDDKRISDQAQLLDKVLKKATQALELLDKIK